MYAEQALSSLCLNPIIGSIRTRGISACEAKAVEIAESLLNRGRVANIGGGRNARWPMAVCADAAHDMELDFNTKPLPFDSESIGLAVCEQVIEHLHNTTWFLSELQRILEPGGNLLLSTENLASIPNLLALALQRAPFSTQPICGKFVGGWKDGPAGYAKTVSSNSPIYSGIFGHVRVMTVGQIRDLLYAAGFQVQNKWGFSCNHYVLFHAIRQ